MGQYDIIKVGDWKTIDQRERTQTRSRKTMRNAGGAAGVGVGLVGAGATYDGGKGAKNIKNDVNMQRAWNKGAKTKGLKAVNNVARAAVSSGARNPAGAALIGGAALAGGGAVTGAGAKGVHTYQQHKVNQRRRSNAKKKVSKTDIEKFSREVKGSFNRGKGYSRSKGEQAAYVGGTAAGVVGGGLMGNAMGSNHSAGKGFKLGRSGKVGAGVAAGATVLGVGANVKAKNRAKKQGIIKSSSPYLIVR